MTELSTRRTDTDLTVLCLPLEDPRVQPLVDGLTEEYDSRYGTTFGGAAEEMRRYPSTDFVAPHGTLLILQENGQTVAGGAFRRYDEQTAELKRIWTHADHRRRGLARQVLLELEDEAARYGYRRIYLTTGPRQPEAKTGRPLCRPLGWRTASAGSRRLRQC